MLGLFVLEKMLFSTLWVHWWSNRPGDKELTFACCVGQEEQSVTVAIGLPFLCLHLFLFQSRSITSHGHKTRKTTRNEYTGVNGRLCGLLGIFYFTYYGGEWRKNSLLRTNRHKLVSNIFNRSQFSYLWHDTNHSFFLSFFIYVK